MIALVGLALLPSLLISAQPLEVRQYGGGSYNDPASPPAYTTPTLPTAINITADALINYYNASNVFIPPPPVVYQATCTNIMIPVTVSSNNTNITAVGLPKNNREVTAIVNTFLTTGSNLSSAYGTGTFILNATYEIGATLCIPPANNARNLSGGTIQFLQHGIGFDRSYWDFALNTLDGTAPNNASYVQVANANGYATLAIDRLGCGISSHPDPILEIQTQTFIEITRSINIMLKEGKIGGVQFNKVVNVGHSYGSIIAAGLVSQHPELSDGIVLTGFSTDGSSLPLTLAAWNLHIARTVAVAPTVQSIPLDISNGYWTTADISVNEFAFFKYPHFEEDVLQLAEATKQPFGIGTLFTLTKGVVPAPLFKGPVFTVTGNEDFIFCGGNCSVGNVLAKVADNYPASINATFYSIPDTGHATNLHHSSPATFCKIQDWFKFNNF